MEVRSPKEKVVYVIESNTYKHVGGKTIISGKNSGVDFDRNDGYLNLNPMNGVCNCNCHQKDSLASLRQIEMDLNELITRLVEH